MSERASVLVLAAGKGVRMRSARPKVLHELCGLSMLEHVLAALRAADLADVALIVGAQLKEHVSALGLPAVVQEPQKGTGHAVRTALAALPRLRPVVLIVSADMPLVTGELLSAVVAAREQANAALALVTARVQPPTDLGRILRHDGHVIGIVENADATPEQRRIEEVNAGIYCFETAALRRQVGRLRPDNAQAELYLTDCVASLAREGAHVAAVEWQDAREVQGVNNRSELALARRTLQARIAERHMLAGVNIVDPRNTYIDAQVQIGADTTVLPHTHLLGTTRIGADCALGPNATIVNALIGDGVEITYSVVRDSQVAAGVSIGPFAHLRRGAVIETGAHIGNFVELKNTRMGARAKAGHLAYLGDAELGERSNIGAGTITCNFDGKRKHKTSIGKDAFIGSNSSLVAPLHVGAGSLTGAGSVVLRDVPDGERVAGNPAKPLSKKRGPSQEQS